MSKAIDKEAIEERIHTVSCIIKALMDAGARIDHVMKYKGEKECLLKILDGDYDCNN